MKTVTTVSQPAVRDHLAVALDLDDADTAVTLARSLAPWFGVAKVGLELWSAGGAAVVARLHDAGFDVFLDVKLHDIPTTVGRAARVLGRLGVRYVTVHTAGGEAMLRAGVEGLDAGAADAGFPPPVALGVTVLTSEADTSAFPERLAAAAAAGCRGVVCSAAEVVTVKSTHPGLVAVVPGIRLAGADVHDQARVGAPGDVARAGADLLVIGRAVTAAPDPLEAARTVSTQVGAALTAR